MMIGLCGMSYFSSKQKEEVIHHRVIDTPLPTTLELVPSSQFDITDDNNNTSTMEYIENSYEPSTKTITTDYNDDNEIITNKINKKLLKLSSSDDDYDILDNSQKITNNDEISFCNFHISRRKFGLLFAIFNGVWGGSVLIPMHYTT